MQVAHGYAPPISPGKSVHVCEAYEKLTARLRASRRATFFVEALEYVFIRFRSKKLLGHHWVA